MANAGTHRLSMANVYVAVIMTVIVRISSDHLVNVQNRARRLPTLSQVN